MTGLVVVMLYILVGHLVVLGWAIFLVRRSVDQAEAHLRASRQLLLLAEEQAERIRATVYYATR